MPANSPNVQSLPKGGMYQTKNSNQKLQQQSPLRKVSTDSEDSVETHMTPTTTSMNPWKTHAPLSRDYLDKVRPFIDLIDTLRAHGLDQDVSLPAVAVIGDQSAGKSSTLEAISGIQLPRGSGIVTRCPLVLRLKSTVQGPKKWRAHIQYLDKTKKQIKADITNPEDIGDYVREAQQRITGDDKGISDKLITLDVESEEVPDLTLIDLPGIVRVATDGQARNIGDQIKHLIKERIEKQETIILAVVPANQDIATTEAIKLAKEFDPDGRRTLGVVTKPDLIDKGTENELVAIVNNRAVPLQKGYTVVKCRGQQMIQDKVPLEQALREEDRFFRDQPHFREVDQSLLGVRNLSKKLTTELVNQIMGTIPELKNDVATKINETQERLSEIGRGLPTDPAEMHFFCVQVLNRFIKKMKENSEGRMFSAAREIYSYFLEKMAAKTPDYGSADFVSKIEIEAEQHRGHELPRFMNYKVCEKLIQGILKQYEGPALQCLERVGQLVENMMMETANEALEQFPHLNRMVKSRLMEIRLAAREVCRARIEEILEMEMIVFTQDKIYCHDLDIVKETYRKMEEARDIVYGQLGHRKVPPLDAQINERLAKGHRLSSASKSRDVDAEHRRTTAEEIFHMIQAYMEVSIRRLSDYIPLTITLHLINRLREEVHTKVMAILAEPDLNKIVYEDESVVNKRDALKAKLLRLETAKKELVKF